MKEKLDIKFKNDGLSSLLSNLHPHKFNFDGYDMASMEGFLQSLKIPYKGIKEQMFNEYGYNAWMVGQKNDWTITQELYWVYEPIGRHTTEYTDLLYRAYDALFDQNSDFRDALKDSMDYNLDHSIGQTDTELTIMTKKEFLHQINRQRDKLKPNRFFDLKSIFKF